MPSLNTSLPIEGALAQAPARAGFSSRRGRFRRLRERIIEGILLLAALSSVAITLGIVGILLYESATFFRHVGLINFLTDTQWTPLFENAHYGILPLLTGTLTVTLIALAVAMPLGTISAIWLSEYAPHKLREILKPALELLGAVPTVVYGYFALLFVTPLLQKLMPDLPGFNMLSAGLVIGIMIIPYISSLSEDAMHAVPMHMREGSYAMGATRMQTALRVVVPASFSGITAAYILGISRALGETMVVAVAAGMQPSLTMNPMQPAATITAYIVQVSLGDLPHGSIGYQSIFAAGLALMLMTLLFNVGGYLLRKRYREAYYMQDLKPLIARRKATDFAFGVLGALAICIALLTLGALIYDLLRDGVPRLSWAFFTNFPSRFPDRAGILSAWVGSCLIMLVTMILALPLGVGAGIYLEEYAPKNWVTAIIEVNIANLAGVPSIIWGLMALGIFVHGMKLGSSIQAAGMTLGLLVLPIVIISTREAIRAIPRDIREASYACGATRWQTTWYHVIPYSMGGILTGSIIGLSRAIGETAPLITIGALSYIAFLPESPFQSQFPFINFRWMESGYTALPIQMFNWVSRPDQRFHFNAAAAGIVLILLTLSMNALAIFLRYRLRKRIHW